MSISWRLALGFWFSLTGHSRLVVTSGVSLEIIKLDTVLNPRMSSLSCVRRSKALKQVQR